MEDEDGSGIDTEGFLALSPFHFVNHMTMSLFLTILLFWILLLSEHVQNCGNTGSGSTIFINNQQKVPVQFCIVRRTTYKRGELTGEEVR